MQDDERAIRKLISDWFTKSESGDVEGVLELMTEDVVFMVVGRPPFGKAEFAESARKMKGQNLRVVAEVLELRVQGSIAFSRVQLQITVDTPDGKQVRRAGHAMSVLLKQADGRWLVARDANLLGAA
jgi:uncharacterized protein (TIGR02246 family)